MARHRGRGMASINYPIGMNLGGDPSQALVHSNPTGKFTVALSSIDLGQGLKSVMRQICAETLGVPVEDVYSAIQAQFGSLTVSQYNLFSHVWWVIMQSDARYRQNPEWTARTLYEDAIRRVLASADEIFFIDGKSGRRVRVELNRQPTPPKGPKP